MQIKSQEHLKKLLKKHKYDKYIDYQESYKSMLERHPILLNFMTGKLDIFDGNNFITFSSIKINEYLGEDIIEYQAPITFFIMNKILNFIYKK